MSTPDKGESTLTFGQRIGLLFNVEGAVLSVISVSLVLGLAIYKWLQRTVLSWGRRNLRRPDASDSSLFLNLMIADLVQAIGNMPSLKWIRHAQIIEGHLCTAQAVLKQVGINGVAWTSLAIAVHTFSVLVLRWNPPAYASKAMVIGVWVFTAAIVGISYGVHRHQHYYGESGHWCWITENFQAQMILTEYLWVWLAGVVMAILYSIMFAVMRGWFIIDNGIYWYENYNPSDKEVEEIETEAQKEMKAIANLMLFYPAVYIFCVLPNSISRWMSFRDTSLDRNFPPYQFTFFASTIFALSGMFNVILFFATRPELIVSPNFTIEPEQVPLQHGRDSSGFGSNKFGHLPDRQYTGPSPDLENLEKSTQSDFDPRTLSESNRLHASPLIMNTSLPSRRSASDNPGYLSPYQRSKGSSQAEEEEGYGHLPH